MIFLTPSSFNKNNNNVESVPDDKHKPTGTSEIKCFLTEFFNFSYVLFSVLLLFSKFNESLDSIKNQINSKILKNKNVILIGNKSDLKINTSIINFFKKNDIRIISAKKPKDIRSLIDTVDLNINKHIIRGESSISINQRHYDSLSKVKNAMENVKKNLKEKFNTDLIALDIKYSLSYLGEITGEITNDDILSNIFSKFCIGK